MIAIICNMNSFFLRSTRKMVDTANSTNPRARAGVLSVLLFFWMNDVLKLGNKRSLSDQDLLPLLEDQRAELLVGKAEKNWLRE